MNIRENIEAYYDHVRKCPTSRLRSWEHCSTHFGAAFGSQFDVGLATLNLAFYLASWGMYRGSTLLLQHDYTVHRGGVRLLSEPRFERLRHGGLWESVDRGLVDLVVAAGEGVRAEYRKVAPDRRASDTLVTKVLLGVFGCVPAIDEYFKEAWKGTGTFGARFVAEVGQFCVEHRNELLEAQRAIESESGLRYSLMKLVDMAFWQEGQKGA